jgi:hypothetical protein
MAETVGAGLVLAALSALTFMAYQHPNAFPKIALPLLLLAIVGMACALAWNSGNYNVRSAVLSLVPFEKFQTAIDAMDARLIPAWIGLGIPAGLMVYLSFLLRLPQILGMQQQEQKKDDEEHN